jgi:hypothetical protein
MNEEDSCEDKIVVWFSQGFFHILQKIFLRLPLKSANACKLVSKDWSTIVDYFHKSEAERYWLHSLLSFWANAKCKVKKNLCWIGRDEWKSTDNSCMYLELLMFDVFRKTFRSLVKNHGAGIRIQQNFRMAMSKYWGLHIVEKQSVEMQ